MNSSEEIGQRYITITELTKGKLDKEQLLKKVNKRYYLNFKNKYIKQSCSEDIGCTNIIIKELGL